MALLDPWEAVKWVAIFRLILPEALFRLCGGRIENLGELAPLAVRAGLNGVMITEQETSRIVHIVAEPWVQSQTQPLLIVGRVEVNSPLRDEAAALPVDLVVKTAAATATSR